MILAVTENTSLARNMLLSAAYLAFKLDKKLTLSVPNGDKNKIKDILNFLSVIIEKPAEIKIVTHETEQINEICEQHDALFLFLQLQSKKRFDIQKKLNSCRDLRIPYILFENNFGMLQTNKVIVPVGYLEEEIEKAQFASAFGRFCNSHIQLLQAADYGSKAAATTTKMTELFGKFSFNYEISKANKDSFGVDAEAVKLAPDTGAGLVIISASREYGLDDIIFGPKELLLIKKSVVPLMLVNPRGDLYTLCD